MKLKPFCSVLLNQSSVINTVGVIKVTLKRCPQKYLLLKWWHHHCSFRTAPQTSFTNPTVPQSLTGIVETLRICSNKWLEWNYRLSALVCSRSTSVRTSWKVYPPDCCTWPTWPDSAQRRITSRFCSTSQQVHRHTRVGLFIQQWCAVLQSGLTLNLWIS